MISGLAWSTPAEHPNVEATTCAAGREQQIQFK